MMPRGGKRPGAGAPKGNLNALKHGLRSKQFARFGAILAESPAARAALLRFADYHDLKNREADEIAAHLMEQIVSRGLIIGRDRLLLLPEFTEAELQSKLHRRRRSLAATAAQPGEGPKDAIEQRSIRKTARKAPRSVSAQTPISKNTPADNQSPNAGNNTQSDNTEGNSNDRT